MWDSLSAHLSCDWVSLARLNQFESLQLIRYKRGQVQVQSSLVTPMKLKDADDKVWRMMDSLILLKIKLRWFIALMLMILLMISLFDKLALILMIIYLLIINLV